MLGEGCTCRSIWPQPYVSIGLTNRYIQRSCEAHHKKSTDFKPAIYYLLDKQHSPNNPRGVHVHKSLLAHGYCLNPATPGYCLNPACDAKGEPTK